MKIIKKISINIFTSCDSIASRPWSTNNGMSRCWSSDVNFSSFSKLRYGPPSSYAWSQIQPHSYIRLPYADIKWKFS